MSDVLCSVGVSSEQFCCVVQRGGACVWAVTWHRSAWTRTLVQHCAVAEGRCQKSAAEAPRESSVVECSCVFLIFECMWCDSNVQIVEGR